MLDYRQLAPLRDVAFGTYEKMALKNESWVAVTLADERTTVRVGINYRCPDTRHYEWLNFNVIVWHMANTAMFTCPTYAELEGRIQQAIAQLDGACQHANRRELTQHECQNRAIPHYGACWHVYECADCGLIQSVDTSG